MVADVAMDSAKSECYDRMEIMRDPSHTHALTHEEFTALFQHSRLLDCRRSTYGVDIELEAQLRASFPKPGDEPRLKDMISSDIGIGNLGINARREDDKVIYTVPISVYVGRKE